MVLPLLARCAECPDNVRVTVEISKLKKIKALVLDVDGVMTDTRIWMDSSGEWRRFFSIRDGVGIKRLIAQGYRLGVITGSSTSDIRARVKTLGIPYFYEGAEDKSPAFDHLLKATDLKENEVAYVGDDIFDIPLLRRVAFAATVPDAVDEVKEVAHYVTHRRGGEGAVREVCDLIHQYGAFSGAQG
ncbi:MAG: HAD-IIIA family hydrolase [Bdellovibrionaceae bacterium]|nr:HAD-IIIA family hydrolase [Pseudobdellovibrionaceae bacterium]